MSLRAPKRRSRRVLENAALVVASVVVLLVVLEIATRLLTNLPPVIGERDPLIGKRYRPHFRSSVFVEEAGREIFLAFNRDGFRGGDVPDLRAADARRIAVLGDSFVAAVACDESDTAVARLQGLLDASRPGLRWEVLNFGVSGSSTGQELVLYRKVVARYRPDIVIVAYYVGNDFSDNSARLSSNPRIYFEIDGHGELAQLPFSAARSSISVWLNRHSRFYVWQKQANDILRSRRDDGYRIYDAEPGDDLEEVWKLNERLVAAIDDEVEADRGRFVLAVLPSGAQVYRDVWHELLRQNPEVASRLDPDYPQRRFGDLGRRYGIAVVTMLDEFRAAAGGARADDTPADELLFFGGNGHFTARGNRLAASVLHRFLVEGDGAPILSRVASPGASRPPAP